MSNFHEPVLLEEVVEYFKVESNKWYIDATLGGGGHAQKIVEQGGNVLGIDQDTEALEYVTKNLNISIENKSLLLANGNFRDIENIAHLHNLNFVSGILFDLGISSHQLDTRVRGFSFRQDAPLDMRMDKSLAVTAADLVNGLSKKELTLLFRKYGEESKAHIFADRIIAQRKVSPIQTTYELAQILGQHKKTFSAIHPATKVFQALRIAVNDELYSIEEALPKALNLLERNGRIIVISFHSLEDRIIKHYFDDFAKKGFGHVITKKPVLPKGAEKSVNKRSRSAKLRVFEKL